jgi:transcriptional regulator with XRE-family HTH domain
MICQMTTFGEWLTEKITERKMKPIRLAKIAHLDPGLVSRLLKDERGPSVHTLYSIADALEIPHEEAIRAAVGKQIKEIGDITDALKKDMAGLLPPKREDDLLINQITFWVSKLPEEDKQDVLAYVEMRRQIAEKRERDAAQERKTKSSGT